MKSLLASCCLLLFCMVLREARADEPRVSRVRPGAIAPGATTRLTLDGSDLAAVSGLWAEFAARVSVVEASAGRAVLEVALEETAQPGVYGVRVIGERSVSNVVFIAVDDLATSPVVLADSVEEAPLVGVPAAVDGVLGSTSAFLAFDASPGDRLTFEVLAQRLGSPLDPVLELMDADGNVVVFTDDTPGLGDDARFRHRFEHGGRHVLALRDSYFRDGDEHRYRIRVGDFPAVSSAFPLGVRRGVDAALETPGGGRAALHAPHGLLPRLAAVGLRGDASAGSAFACVEVSDVEERLETEPNDTRDAATPLAVPGAVSGRFRREGDVDVYRVEVREGETIRFEGATRSLGSPSFLSMQLVDGNGKVLGESDDEGADEGFIVERFKRSGTYFLRVEELTGAGGPEHAYRLTAAPSPPQVTLTAETDRITLERGKAARIKVNCEREKFEGEVRLVVEGLGGARVESDVIDGKGKETTLTIEADELPAADVVALRLYGIATTGEGATRVEHRIPVSVTPTLRKAHPRLFFPPGSVEWDIVARVVNPASHPNPR